MEAQKESVAQFHKVKRNQNTIRISTTYKCYCLWTYAALLWYVVDINNDLQ